MKRTFFWPGIPRGQGRPRFAGKVAYKSSEDKAYERSILMAYHAAYPGKTAITGAFIIRVTACYPIPKSASKKAREDMLAGRTVPTVKPDIDNVLKAVLDALNGAAFTDDKNAFMILAQKVYAETPGILVEIKDTRTADGD
jgi:Holliday junction resolvase RusA-like endonuclease